MFTFESPGPGRGPGILLSDSPELPAKFSSHEYFSASVYTQKNTLFYDKKL